MRENGYQRMSQEKEGGEKVYLESLRRGKILEKTFLDTIEIDKTKIADAARAGLVHLIKGCYNINEVEAFRYASRLPETVYHEPTLQMAAREGFRTAIAEGISGAENISKFFSFSPDLVETLTDEASVLQLFSKYEVTWSRTPLDMPTKPLIAFIEERGLSPERFGKALQHLDEVRARIERNEEQLVLQCKFAELGKLLRLTGREVPIDPSKAEKILKELLGEKLSTAAMDCLQLLDEHAVPINNQELRAKITEAAEAEYQRRLTRKPREILASREIPQEAHHMASLFYVESRILQNWKLFMEDIRPHGLDFSFSTQLGLHELHNNLSADIEAISLRIRQYLDVAVHSELKNQGQLLSDPDNDVRIPTDEAWGPKDLFLLGTDEENILYLTQARERFHCFTERRDRTIVGGEKWAEIADAGAKLFQHPNDIVMIDHVFDLEHNKNAIFDKDPSLVTQDLGAMQQLKTNAVLDAKRDVRGNTRDLVQILRRVLPESTNLFNRLDGLVARWVDILNAVAREYAARGRTLEVTKYI